MQADIDEMIFFKVFGPSPRNRVLMFMIENNIFDYSKSDIASNCGVSRATLDTFFDELLKLGLLLKTRSVGRATLFKINFESPIVQELVRLNELVTDKYADALAEKQVQKAYA